MSVVVHALPGVEELCWLGNAVEEDGDGNERERGHKPFGVDELTVLAHKRVCIAYRRGRSLAPELWLERRSLTWLALEACVCGIEGEGKRGSKEETGLERDRERVRDGIEESAGELYLFSYA